MSDSFNFETYREIEKKIQDISRKIETLEKEREELKCKKTLEDFFGKEE